MENNKTIPAIRNSVLLAGVEQSGKTYFAERMAEAYIKAGRPALIYNVAKDSDFADAEICSPLSKDQLYRHTKNKAQQYNVKTLDNLPMFQDENTGKILPFSSFTKFYAGKLVKIYRVKDEPLLFKSFFQYLYNTMIIFDDNRATTRHGLSHQQIELFSRKNHAGFKYANGKQGVDLFFIYHNLDTVPAELYDYINRAVLFQLNRVPDNRIDNPEFSEKIEQAVLELKTLPRFSYIELILRGYPEIKTIKYEHK